MLLSNYSKFSDFLICESLNNALMSICDEESAHVRSRGSAIEELQQLIMWNHTTSNMYTYIYI